MQHYNAAVCVELWAYLMNGCAGVVGPPAFHKQQPALCEGCLACVGGAGRNVQCNARHAGRASTFRGSAGGGYPVPTGPMPLLI